MLPRQKENPNMKEKNRLRLLFFEKSLVTLEKDYHDKSSFRRIAGSILFRAGVSAGVGAAVGSVVPGIGTALGAIIGAIGGFFLGCYTCHRDYKRAKNKYNQG